MKPHVFNMDYKYLPKHVFFFLSCLNMCARGPMILRKFIYVRALHCHCTAYEELVPVKPVLSVFFFFAHDYIENSCFVCLRSYQRSLNASILGALAVSLLS